MTVDTARAEKVKELVVGAIESAKTGDIEGFLAVMHPDVVVHEPEHLPYGGVYRGHEGFMELFAEATKLLDLPKLELVSATADDERCVLLMTCELLSNGETMHITEHWIVEDDKVTEARVFWFGLHE